MTAHVSTHCRLCHRPLADSDCIDIGPFPKAAQYYPTVDAFAQDVGAVLHIFECRGCGLVQLSNPPVDYYQQVITAASLSPVVQQQRTTLFSALKAQLPQAAPLRALEIGCAKGENLPLLASLGFNAIGLEVLPAGASTPPAGVLNTYLLDVDPSQLGPFDLVLSFNYLEHQPDPRAFLERCHALLSDAGRLLLTVPNLELLLNTGSGHEFVTDHLVYFTAETLQTALRLTGFELLDISIINNQFDIQIIARKRPAQAIAPCKASLQALVQALNTKLRGFQAEGKKVAVWGAGHRTLALLSLSEYELIHCIIDSAPFKHHQFAPISHLEILPPDTLLDPNCGIDVILVMVPGIYPREVVQKIQSLPIAYHAEPFPPDA